MQFSSALNSNPQGSQDCRISNHPRGSSANMSERSSDVGEWGDRLHIHPLHAPAASQLTPSPSTHAGEYSPEDIQAVIQGLSAQPKSLPPRFFYDDRGSRLFEQICQLPEYYLTRTETQIFQTCADAIAQITGACELVELGSGSSTKTRLLLDAYQRANLPLRYVPIDVSAGILKDSAHQLLADYATLKIYGMVGTYEQALHALMPSTLPSRLIAFIGSTLGNLLPDECDQFLAHIAEALEPGDYFLLGIDLQKSIDVLEAAYNDSQGITAAFNLNMLHHLNQKFAANFDGTQFEHVAFYNTALNQIEMHLKSLTHQEVHFSAPNFSVSFEAGETIHSEVSRKFDLQQMQQQLRSHGLATVKVWTDPQEWFGVILAQR